MSKAKWFSLVSIGLTFLSLSAFAVDGVVLINQASAMAAGGFPYKITQSGSYKLSGNLVVPANTDGIDIFADDVQLDLNGFTISGPGSCDGFANGIRTQPAKSCTGNSVFPNGIFSVGANVTVRNGSVRGMGTGIEGGSLLVEEIHATNNSIQGIAIGGPGEEAIVRRCFADNNGSTGILLGGGVAENNEASLNGYHGLNAFEATVMGNSLSHNGYDGLVVGNAVVFGNNSIQANTVSDVSLTLLAHVYLSQNNNLCSIGVC